MLFIKFTPKLILNDLKTFSPFFNSKNLDSSVFEKPVVPETTAGLFFDFLIKLRRLSVPLELVKSIITSEKLRRVRNSQLEEFIETLTNEFKELKS